MEVFAFIGAIIALVAMAFVVPLISTATGLFVGWVVSLTPLGGSVVFGLSYLGLHVPISSLAAVGAALGFIGGFFYSSASISSSNN